MRLKLVLDIGKPANFVRNIGSGVGTSMVATMVARRTQVHQAMLASHTSWSDSAFRDAVQGLAVKLRQSGVLQAEQQAIARIYGIV